LKFSNLLLEEGELSFFAARFFKESFKRPVEFKEFLRQCYNMGIVPFYLLRLQDLLLDWFYPSITSHTQEFGAVSWMPSMVSIFN
jgi:phospholipid/cholesterol/gamma-HCH transport system permease protein